MHSSEDLPFPFLRVEEVASTNDALIALAANGASDGTAFVARRQTAGRGRRGHEWVGLPGRHVYLSVLHRSKLAASELSGLTLDIGVAVAGVIEALGLAARLKWPNDILLAGKKVGGILCELIDGPSVVVGLGLNVQAVQMPPELSNATTLEAELPAEVELDVATLTIDLVRAIQGVCRSHDARGAPDVQAWLAKSADIGTRLRRTADGRVGQAVAVAPDGALLVEWDGSDGPERFVAGELEFIAKEASQ